MDIVSKKDVEIFFTSSSAITFTNIGYDYRTKKIIDHNNGLSDLTHKIIRMSDFSRVLEGTVAKYVEAYLKLNITYGGFYFDEPTKRFIQNRAVIRKDDKEPWYIGHSLYYFLTISPPLFFDIADELGILVGEYFPEFKGIEKTILRSIFHDLENYESVKRLGELLRMVKERIGKQTSDAIIARLQTIEIPDKRLAFLPEDLPTFLVFPLNAGVEFASSDKDIENKGIQYLNPDKNKKDLAMKANGNGGIDLDLEKIALQTKDNGEAISFNIDLATLQRLQNASGVTPIIVGIHSLGSLQQFMGVPDPAMK